MSKSNQNYQTFTILTHPRVVNKERIHPNKGTLIKKANHQFYKYDLEAGLFVSWTFGAIAMVFGVYLLKFEHTGFWDYLFTYSIIITGLFFFIYGLTAKKENKMFILDRLNGKVTYPDLFYLPPLTGKFTDLKAVISISGDIDGAPGREYLKFVNSFKPRKLGVLRTIANDDPYKEWSLYVWYMDKNRPLPPGTAFDTYREQDFERRKAEGFPKPLFESRITTPEATKIQQEERRKIGGW